MKKFTTDALFLSLLLAILLSSCSLKKEQGRPNVILFIVDDLGWKDLSSYGSELYKTPNVDRLASEGVRFTNAYASSPVCSPTRASILTGKHPARLKCTDWIIGHKRPYAALSPPKWTEYLNPEDTTLAELLKSIGYKTIHIGKWHLGEKEEYWPEFHGFDRNIGGWKMGMPKKENNIGGYFSPYFNPRLPDGSDDEYLTERLTEESLQFIQDSNEPFFLNFWLYNVHTPLQARKEKIAKYDTLVRREKLQSNAVYAAMIEHMDAALGSVVDKLKETGKYENTIFIFGSDNGGFLGVRGDQEKKPRITSNHPLRSGKGDIYDGGVRVPFIVSWPTLIGGNRESDVLTISTDILPTILGLMGGKSLIPASVDGIDLSSYLLEDQIPKREALYWHYPHYHTEGAEPFSAIREGNWKLIHTYEKNELELYNLAEDLGEQINLIEKYPQKGNELEIKLKRWKKIVHAQDPTINENFDSLRQHLWQKSLIVW